MRGSKMAEKNVKLVVPLVRSRHVDEVIRERIGDFISRWDPDRTMSAEAFISYLVHSTDAWEELSRWRMEARTEGLRRYEMSKDYTPNF
ncbi:MAG: hypothetical protein EBR82_00170 [Caulobacteraceae bacterium]|nr:hypothetical protein [Caulobacteraceae bacterium]